MAPKSEKAQLTEAAKEAAAERVHMLNEVRAKLGALRPLAAVKLAEVAEEFASQSSILDDLMAQLRSNEETVLNKTERPTIKRKTYAQLAAEIKHFRSLPDCDDVSVTGMEHQLELLSEWDRIHAWQEELSTLRAKLDARRETNRKAYDKAREHERKQAMLRRVLEQRLLAGCPDLDFQPKATDVVTLEFEVPVAAQALIAPPVVLPRRLERICGAAVDRAPERNRSRTLFVNVLSMEQEFTEQFLRETDWTGGSRVKVDAKVVPQLIGKGGAGLRSLEDSNRCIIHIQDSDVIVYGRKSDTEKVLTQIAATKAERVVESATAQIALDHPAIARALNYSLNRKLREIEKNHSVNSRINFGSVTAAAGAADAVFGADVITAGASGGGSPPSGPVSGGQKPSITIRGADAATVNKAKAAIEEVVGPLRCLEIPLNGVEASKRLFSRVSFNGEVDLSRRRGGKGGDTVAVGDKFMDFASSVITRVAFLRHGDKLAVVGSAEAIAEVEDEIKELVKRAGYTSTRVKLESFHIASFRRERLDGIEAGTGASVTIIRTRSTDSEIPVVSVEIFGSEEQKAAAEAIVRKFIENEQEATQVVKEPETMVKLLQDQALRIKTLQADYDLRISADKQEMTLQLIGSKQGIAAAKEAIQKLDAEMADMVVESVEIPDPSLVGRIIGTRGATIANIRTSSGAASVDIRDSDRRVVAKGNPEAVAKAIAMVKEILDRESTATSRRAANNNNNNSTGFFPAVERKQVATVVASVGGGGTTGWGESVVPDSFANDDDNDVADGSHSLPRGWQAAPAVTVNNSSAAFYPALGEEMPETEKRRTRPKRPTGRKSAVDNVGLPVPAAVEM